MTNQLPPRVDPRTPRDPKPDRGRPAERPDKPERPERPAAPPRELMKSRRDFARAFSTLRRGWRDGTAGEPEAEAFQKLAELAAQLGDGTATGQEVLDKLA